MIILFWVFVGLLVIAYYLGTIVLSRKLQKKVRRKRLEWPTTKGSITSSKITHQDAQLGGDGPYPEQWNVKIKFSYDVGNISYLSRQEWRTGIMPPAYGLGDVVTVSYNPTKPKEALVNLGPGMYAPIWLIAIVTILIILPMLVPVIIVLAYSRP
jgi:hypothetical protein